MHPSRLLLLVLGVGWVWVGSACSNLTSPSGENPDSLSSVGDSPTPPAAQTQPTLIQEQPNKPVMVRRILIAYEGAEDAKPEVKRTLAEARKLVAEVSEELKKPNADFAALARTHSDAPEAPRGGLMPAFTREARHDPALKAAAFQLEVGEKSGVIKTRQGLLILERLK